MIVPRGKEFDYIYKFLKSFFPGANGVSVFCFTGLSNEMPKSNVFFFFFFFGGGGGGGGGEYFVGKFME